MVQGGGMRPETLCFPYVPACSFPFLLWSFVSPIKTQGYEGLWLLAKEVHWWRKSARHIRHCLGDSSLIISVVEDLTIH